MDEVWFLLEGGSSPDGRGPGRYEGRTTKVVDAVKHYKKVKKNPYSTGRVIVITDTKHTMIHQIEDFLQYGATKTLLRKKFTDEELLAVSSHKGMVG